jgi:hypothetical protein
LSSALRPRADATGDEAVYLLTDPPLSLLSEGGVVTIRLAGAADDEPRLLLTLAANPTGPERQYVFAPVDAAAPDSGPSATPPLAGQRPGGGRTGAGLTCLAGRSGTAHYTGDRAGVDGEDWHGRIPDGPVGAVRGWSVVAQRAEDHPWRGCRRRRDAVAHRRRRQEETQEMQKEVSNVRAEAGRRGVRPNQRVLRQ